MTLHVASLDSTLSLDQRKPPHKKRKKFLPTSGVEPPTFRLQGERNNHYAKQACWRLEKNDNLNLLRLILVPQRVKPTRHLDYSLNHIYS